MSSDEVLDRSEVARGLDKELERINETAAGFCIPDATMTILRLEDVYDDWRNSELRRLKSPSAKQDQDELQASAYLRRANYMLRVCHYALGLLLEQGKPCGRELRNFPHIYYILSLMDPQDAVIELTENGRIKEEDAYFVTSVKVMGTFPLTEMVLMEGARGTEAERFMAEYLTG